MKKANPADYNFVTKHRWVLYRERLKVCNFTIAKNTGQMSHPKFKGK